MISVSLSGDEKSLETIWDWYEDQIEALLDFKLKIKKEMAADVFRPKFMQYSTKDIDEYFLDSNEDLDHLTCFDLISATEALLKVDFFQRIDRKDKKDIGRLFRAIYKAEGNKVSLESHIIETWKKVIPAKKKDFSDFIGLLRYRHWLAHGRYWTPKYGQQYTVQITYKIAYRVINAIRTV